jgi:beta-lactam-binding protein with PASTA domain
VKQNGTAVAWGCAAPNYSGACEVPSGLTHVSAVAASGAHSLALVVAPTVASKVPNVVAKRVARAKRTIAQRHCRTGRVRYASSRKRKGIVISQSPRPESVLPARSAINLVVSRGRRH